MSDLLDQLDEPMAESWIGEPDDKLVGTVTNLSSRDGGYGEYPIVTLDVESGTVGGKPIEVPVTLALHGLGTVLQGELWAEGKPGAWKLGIGDTLAVKYLGKKQGRTNEYDAWRVIIKRASLADALDRDENQGNLFSS